MTLAIKYSAVCRGNSQCNFHLSLGTQIPGLLFGDGKAQTTTLYNSAELIEVISSRSLLEPSEKCDASCGFASSVFNLLPKAHLAGNLYSKILHLRIGPIWSSATRSGMVVLIRIFEITTSFVLLSASSLAVVSDLPSNSCYDHV